MALEPGYLGNKLKVMMPSAPENQALAAAALQDAGAEGAGARGGAGLGADRKDQGEGGGAHREEQAGEP